MNPEAIDLDLAGKIEVQALTKGPKHHFFGYYDKFQCDGSNTRMLTMEYDGPAYELTGAEPAGIGVIDLKRGNKLELVAETRAWCYQLAAMVQWLPSDPNRKIIFNVVEGDHLGCCVLDLETGKRRIYNRPIYTISPDGKFALTPSFSRLARTRPGYGYPGVPDPREDVDAPDDDGIFFLDLETGKSKLIISFRQMHDYRTIPLMLKTKHWFNHLQITPDGKRFAFLHRWARTDGRRWETRLFTANVDGSELYPLNIYDFTSHAYWRDSATFVSFATQPCLGTAYRSFTDRTSQVRTVAAGKLVTDGHMSFSDKHDWMLTDTYAEPPSRLRNLLLYNEKQNKLVRLGAFKSPSDLVDEVKCDLHPRWSRDGRLVTFDSCHANEERQVYMVDVGEIVFG